MSLYQIDSDLLALLETGFNMACVDEETGEIDEEKARKYLEDLPIERERKLEAYGMVIKNYQAEIEAIKKEQSVLTERRRAKENQVERLKEAVTKSLELFNQPRFETARVAFGFRKSISVEVQDIDKLDRKYIVEKIERQPAKTEIKKALQHGEIIEGAVLVEHNNLQVK